MRRGSSTVLSLIGEVHREVLAPLNAAPNVSVVRPRGEEPDAVERAFAEAAGRAAPFVVVSGDLLHDVAVEWRNRWDVRSGRDDFEVKAGEALGRWRSGRLELPDYYLVALDEHPVAPGEPARPGATHPDDLYLAVFRTERPNRVLPLGAGAGLADRILATLAALPQGPWWPGLDRLIQAARSFYPATITA